MKKIIAMLMVVPALLCGCTGTVEESCEPFWSTELQVVKVDDILYYNTFEKSTLEARCGVMDGEITSAVAEGIVPEENDQSNFGSGYGYQMGTLPGTIEVQIGEEFFVFAELYPENRFGVKLQAENVTPTGLTLVCTREDTSEWEVTTGSAWRLQSVQDGTWKSYDTVLDPNVEYAWTMEAYLITAASPATWELDWQWMYGELPAGRYRLSKDFSAVLLHERQPPSERFSVYVEFTIS